MMVDCHDLVERTRSVFMRGKTRDIKWRKKQLLALADMMEKEQKGFCDAAYKDLRKHSHESIAMEINMVRNDAINAYNHLDEWTQPQKVAKTLLMATDSLLIQPDPLGVTLIIGAWNYPIQLPLLPLVGAIAAGNCCIVKPSEVSEATAQFIEHIVPKYLDIEAFPVVNGGIPETQALLAEKFDLIFYTGSSSVAKVVYEAAARHLTPVILELGGKSPVYVDKSSDMDLAARRILWGRFVNTGQTCIAPDYVMCTPEVQDKLLERLRVNMKKFYGDDAKTSDSYGRIVNARHFQRVKSFLDGASIAIGGKTDEKEKYIEPTVVIDCKPDDPCMTTEIFGPVLPIMKVHDVDDAIEFINSRDKPLAMYIFSKNNAIVHKILNSTSAGGVTVNDTIMHAGVETLPFGGVGTSGTGSYHGKFSFDAFSHKKGVCHRPQGGEFINELRYPPYSSRKTNIISWVMGKNRKSSWGLFGNFVGFLKLVVFGVILGAIGKVFGVDKYLPRLK